jgi:hypothetical protein
MPAPGLAQPGVAVGGPLPVGEQDQRAAAGAEAALDEVGHDLAPARASRAEDEID